MLQQNIALDSICLGEETGGELHAISHALGCYKLEPTSLVNALAICELEPFLALTDRPSLVAKMPASISRSAFRTRFLSMPFEILPTVVTEHQIPKREDHPNQNDSFIPLADAARRPARASTSVTPGARSNLRTTRLLTEMRQIATGGPRENYDVYVSETDMSFWKVVMQGPSQTPYAGGTFMLYIHAEDRYPAFAPKARFITRIKHMNVGQHGRICHSILDRDWTSDTSMARLLDAIYGMLLQAETSDPVNTTITLGYHHDQVEFHEEAQQWTRKYADISRGDWRQALLDGENWDVNDEIEESDDGEEDGEDDEDGAGEDDEMED